MLLINKKTRHRRFGMSCCNSKIRRFNSAFKSKKYRKLKFKSKSKGPRILSSIENLSHMTRIYLKRKRSPRIFDDEEQNRPKKIRKITAGSWNVVDNLQYTSSNSESENISVDAPRTLRSNNTSTVTKCKYCKESTDNTVNHVGPSADSMKECDVLNSKGIYLEETEEENPQVNLTEFSVFDEAGHLCPFDGDLIPNDVQLYFSGYIKPIYNDNPDIEGGFPANNMGPINHWWIAGFDIGEKTIIGFSSSLGDYYLRKPSNEYQPFMRNVEDKVWVTKIVIEVLQNCSYEEISYGTLLDELERASVSEETLLKYADFIYDQVRSFDSAGEDGQHMLIHASCMRELAELAGISSTKESVTRTVRRKQSIWTKKDDGTFIKATTTFLVENVFGSLFTEQMSKSIDTTFNKYCVVKLTRLDYNKLLTEGFSIEKEADENCNELDPLSEKACVKKKLIRPCSIRLPRLGNEYQSLLQAYNKKKPPKKIARRVKPKYEEEIESSDEDEYWIPSNAKPKHKSLKKDDEASEEKYKPRKLRKFEESRTCVWVGQPVKEECDRIFFQHVSVEGIGVGVGNFIAADNYKSIGKIKYMWEDDDKKKNCHVHWYIRSCDTVLGEAGNDKELFVTDECEDIPVNRIDNVVDATRLPITPNWNIIGNLSLNEWTAMAKVKGRSNTSYFYQKKYNAKNARFEDVDDREFEDSDEDVGPFFSCYNCDKIRLAEQREIPNAVGKIDLDQDTGEFILDKVRWRDELYQKGTCVFLQPGTLMPVRTAAKEVRQAEEDYDEIEYPEKYRKNYNFTKEDEMQAATEPFEIGLICGIFSKKQIIRRMSDVRINVKKFYRPHNTYLSADEISRLDLNYLYWSDEDEIIQFAKVEGRCYIAYENNLRDPVAVWMAAGPHRFYFDKAYDSRNKRFCQPSVMGMKLGKNWNLSPEATSESPSNQNSNEEAPKPWPFISRPLRSLDVFAGCGGLTEGLHQSGVAECRWAIEKFEAPAEAFSLNYPKAAVFIDDCNHILKKIIKGERRIGDLELPKKGEVELLCGGPPCQGFSRMNAFTDGDYSKFKNSLIISYLSFCDYYRPRYFILENVRNFATFNKSMVLKLTLSCLVKMGYQVTFAVLQCGQYGIPQSRRRVIILAAAPGEILPMFPEPTHTFVLNSTHLTVNIDSQKYVSNIKWTTAAPYRMVTVGDALTDLPKIENNSSSSKKMKYGKIPLTHFQRKMRKNKSKTEDTLTDHVCKQLKPLILARISYIPRVPHADWRDLPNIVVKLPDGTKTEKLKYSHNDVKLGKSSTGALRGVCKCASDPKIRCTPKISGPDRQSNTLIPWCLPHTGNRHGQWGGLYGRLSLDSYFRTVVTNPEPMSKQGRVLHPDQNRVISVRECARSQGFPDSFKFSGNPIDKYAQIGNAVAPPLAEAIGYEIRKCVSEVEKRRGKK